MRRSTPRQSRRVDDGLENDKSLRPGKKRGQGRLIKEPIKSLYPNKKCSRSYKQTAQETPGGLYQQDRREFPPAQARVKRKGSPKKKNTVTRNLHLELRGMGHLPDKKKTPPNVLPAGSRDMK